MGLLYRRPRCSPVAFCWFNPHRCAGLPTAGAQRFTAVYSPYCLRFISLQADGIARSPSSHLHCNPQPLPDGVWTPQHSLLPHCGLQLLASTGRFHAAVPRWRRARTPTYTPARARTTHRLLPTTARRSTPFLCAYLRGTRHYVSTHFNAAHAIATALHLPAVGRFYHALLRSRACSFTDVLHVPTIYLGPDSTTGTEHCQFAV